MLRDLSIDVHSGEFVSIVGASGCGKTTFLRLVDGLIEPTEGRVSIDGQTVHKPDEPHRLRVPAGRPVAVAYRHPQCRARPGDRSAAPAEGARRIADQFLRLVGLGGFNRHYPHELSGGMRQRVNIARALSAGADVLLMDEPFAALDAQTREIMQSELLRIWQETQKTVLLVTHQIDEAVYLSDRVLIFTVRPGRLKQELTIELPRPRELSIKRTPEFVRYTDTIWRAIEEEVRESIGREAADIATSHAT